MRADGPSGMQRGAMAQTRLDSTRVGKQTAMRLFATSTHAWHLHHLSARHRMSHFNSACHGYQPGQALPCLLGRLRVRLQLVDRDVPLQLSLWLSGN